MDETPVKKENAASRYRKSEKCKEARKRYYENKGKETSKLYYENNKEKIIERSRLRYDTLKKNLNIDNSTTITKN